MVELVYTDGTTEVVERCFIVHDRKKDKKGRMRPRERFVAQTRAGGKLKWLKPRELQNVNLQMPAEYSPPRPWPGQA